MTGQAAGAAAALAVRARVEPRDVPVPALQAALRAQGATLRESGEAAPMRIAL